MNTYLREIRQAFRSLLADRHLVLPAVLCLAVGIGVNSTIFSVADGLLVRHLPFEDADRLVLLGEVQRVRPREESARASYLNLRDWREESRTLAGVAGVALRSLTVSGPGGEPERLSGALVSANLFPLLGVAPTLGPGFRDTHDLPNAERVVMISDDLWRTRFGADPTIIGRAIQVDGQPHTTVGVMPPTFRFPFSQDVWVPLTPVLGTSGRFQREVFGVARLAPGVTIEQARGDITAITARLQTQYPEANRGWDARVRPIRAFYASSQTRILVMLMFGAAWFVLLIACGNVANLMVVRATTRMHEISLRRALGASGTRIARQLLTECLLASLLSLPLGIVIALIGVELFARTITSIGPGIPFVFRWEFNERAAIYSLLAAMLAGLVYAVAPAIHIWRGRTYDVIKGSSKGAGAGSRRQWIRSTLVVGQIAASLTALIGASFFVRSFFEMNEANRGVDVPSVMTLQFALPGTAYDTPDRVVQRVDDIVRRVQAVSGVAAAAVSTLIPFDGGATTDGLNLPGRTFERGQEPVVTYAGVTAQFLQALGVPLLRGRTLTDLDVSTRARVAIINETMATRFWPSGDPIGQQFAFATGPDRDLFTVIGVAGNLPNDGPTDEPVPVPSAYVPYSHIPRPAAGLLIRVSGATPTGVVGDVRKAIHAADAGIPLFSVRSLAQVRSEAAFPFRILAAVFGVLGGIALLLAAVGLYGVLASSVSQRRHEIGVRVALGARGVDVTRMMVGQGARLCAIGLALGLLGGIMVAQLLAAAFRGVVDPADPMSVAAVTVVLAVIGLLASYVPARRAARVDPVNTLRNA